MGQVCTVCAHDESFAINEALVVEGKSNRAITRLYGLSKDAVRRHRQHIPELLVHASRSQQVADADALLDKLEELRLKAMDVLKEAEAAHDYPIMLAAIDRASNQLKLLAQLLGKLQEYQVNTQVNISFLEHPDYQRYEDLIARALRPHPEARYAVAGVLKELEK